MNCRKTIHSIQGCGSCGRSSAHRMETLLRSRDENQVQHCVLVCGWIGDELFIPSGPKNLQYWLVSTEQKILIEVTTDDDGVNIHDLQ